MKKIHELKSRIVSLVESSLAPTPPLHINTAAWFLLLALSYSIYIHYISWNFDDSYIVFRIVENILSGDGWAYNAGELYNASTSVLNTVLIAIISKITGIAIPSAAHIVGTVGIFLSGVSLFLILRERLEAGAALAIAIIVMFSLAKNLTWGLETHMFCGCLLLFCFLEYRNATTWWLVAILILLRPDAILIFIMKFIFDFTFRSISKTGILICLLILTPWVIFSLTHFGQIFPDTLSNKMWQGRSGFWGTGHIYLKGLASYLWQNKVFLIMSPIISFGIYRTLIRYTSILFLFIFVAAQQFAYVLLNVPTYHWYLALLNLALTLMCCIGIAELVQIISKKVKFFYQLSKREFDFSLGLLLIVTLFVFIHITQKPAAPDRRDLSYIELSNRINSSAIAPGPLAALEVGTIGYRIDRPIIDLVSLTSKNPEFLTGKNNDLFFSLLPQIVVLHHPVWPMEKAIFEDPRFGALYTLVDVISDTAISTKFYRLSYTSKSDMIAVLNELKRGDKVHFDKLDNVVNLKISENIRCVIDSFAQHPVDHLSELHLEKGQTSVNIDGWAFNSNTKSPLNEVNIVLKSVASEKFVSMKAKPYERPDVANAHSLTSVLMSGFKSEMDISDLSSGIYQLYIVDGDKVSACDKVINFTIN